MTYPNPKTVAAVLTPHVVAMLAARVIAETLREEIDAIKVRVLSEGTYTSDYAEYDDENGNRVTIPKRDWTISDDQSAEYYRLLDLAIRAAGHNPPEGYCPALMAESELRDAQHALITAAERFFPGMTTSKLLCGTKTEGGLETHAKYLDLLAGLVMAA